MTTPVQEALAVLCEGFAVKPDNMSQTRVRALTSALADIPPVLLRPMVDRALRTRKPRWGDLPSVAELREDAEACRLEAVRALGPYEGCCECEDQRGWRAVTHADGARLHRCGCWARRQAKLAALGIGASALALPEVEEYR